MKHPWDFGSNREEIEWLRAKVERLQAEEATLRSHLRDFEERIIPLANAEYAEQEAKVEKLRAALEDIVEWDTSDGHDGDHVGACMGCQRVHHARAALAEEVTPIHTDP